MSSITRPLPIKDRSCWFEVNCIAVRTDALITGLFRWSSLPGRTL